MDKSVYGMQINVNILLESVSSVMVKLFMYVNICTTCQTGHLKRLSTFQSIYFEMISNKKSMRTPESTIKLYF